MSFSKGTSETEKMRTQTASASLDIIRTTPGTSILFASNSQSSEADQIFTDEIRSHSTAVVAILGSIMTDLAPKPPTPLFLPAVTDSILFSTISPSSKISDSLGQEIITPGPVYPSTDNDTLLLGLSIGFGLLGFVSLIGILCFYFWRRHTWKSRIRKTAAWAREVSEASQVPVLHRMPVPPLYPNQKTPITPVSELDSGMRFELATVPAEMDACALAIRRGDVIRWMGEKVRREHWRSASDMQPIVKGVDGEENGGGNEDEDDGQDKSLEKELAVELPVESESAAELPSKKGDTR